jgi:hypothetical protein
MIIIRIQSLKSAEKNGAGRPYLARLAKGIRDSIDRKFVKPVWGNAGKTRRIFETGAKPGDIFETRRWQWDNDRLQYFGGTVWFGVEKNGEITLLTREEAHNSILFGIDGEAQNNNVLALRFPKRVVPDDIQCRLTAPLKFERIAIHKDI